MLGTDILISQTPKPKDEDETPLDVSICGTLTGGNHLRAIHAGALPWPQLGPRDPGGHVEAQIFVEIFFVLLNIGALIISIGCRGIV